MGLCHLGQWQWTEFDKAEVDHLVAAKEFIGFIPAPTSPREEHKTAVETIRVEVGPSP